MSPNNMDQEQYGSNNSARWIIPGIAVGAALALMIARSTRKKTKWERMSDLVADNKAELASTGKNILDRIRIIYEEGSKLVEEAGALWSQGRKLVR